MWKNSVFDLQDVPQKVWEQGFSTFIETLCTKLAKNAEKQQFLSFLRDVLQKSVRKQCFSLLSRHIVQNSHKCDKTSLELFARNSAKNKREDSVFSRYLRHIFTYKVCQKSKKKKTEFFELFARRSAEKC